MRRGVLFVVGDTGDTPHETPNLAVYENVRCLECGGVYTKPSRGGTAKANPGCPDCGYVGWVAINVPFAAESERHHFAAGQPQRRSARSH